MATIHPVHNDCVEALESQRDLLGSLADVITGGLVHYRHAEEQCVGRILAYARTAGFVYLNG